MSVQETISTGFECFIITVVLTVILGAIATLFGGIVFGAIVSVIVMIVVGYYSMKQSIVYK